MLESSRRFRSMFALLFGATLLASTGCGGGGSDGSGGAGGGSPSTSSGPGGSPSTGSGSCDPDTLKTGLPPLFNGNSVDLADCPILELTAKYGEPDAMI